MKPDDVPSQSHSATSVESAKSMSRRRVLGQEQWVYETLRKSAGKADWQLWNMAQHLPGLFDKLSSMHRARIGLVWPSRVLGATPWHPVEDSGRRIVCPDSGKQTVVWRIKARYRTMPYDEWAHAYRNLARGKIDGTKNG
jgi:hypothetical protein